MLQTVGRRLITAQARVLSQVRQYEFCGAQSVTVTVLSPISSVYPCHYNATIIVSLLLYLDGRAGEDLGSSETMHVNVMGIIGQEPHSNGFCRYFLPVA